MLEAGPPAELVGDFALPLPITIICELLGVPYSDRADFRIWSDAVLSTTRYPPEQVASYVARLKEYLAGLIAERRQAARDDLLSALVAARDRDDRLSEYELVALAQAILVAGHETTASQIPIFAYVLLTHPDQLALLRADPVRSGRRRSSPRPGPRRARDGRRQGASGRSAPARDRPVPGR